MAFLIFRQVNPSGTREEFKVPGKDEVKKVLQQYPSVFHQTSSCIRCAFFFKWF